MIADAGGEGAAVVVAAPYHRPAVEIIGDWR